MQLIKEAREITAGLNIREVLPDRENIRRETPAFAESGVGLHILPQEHGTVVGVRVPHSSRVHP